MMSPVWYRFQSCFGAVPAASIDGGIHGVGALTWMKKTPRTMDNYINRKPKPGSTGERSVEHQMVLDDNCNVVGVKTPPVSGSYTPTKLATERSARKLSLAAHLQRLGKQIDEAVAYAEPKLNLHKELKLMLAKAQKMFGSCLSALDEVEQLPRENTVGRETQTSPSLVPKRTTAAADNKPAPLSTPKGRAGKRSNAAADPESADGSAADWQQVRRRKKKKRKKVAPPQEEAPDPKSRARAPKHPRADAVVIKAKDPKSYAAILQRLRRTPELQDPVGNNVNKIRRTATGALLLKLNRASGDSGQLGQKLNEVLGELATATTLRSLTSIEIKDLDEVTTKEEICEALNARLACAPLLTVEAVKTLHKSFAGTQTAVISMSDRLAAEAVSLGRIRIGWVNCRVHEKTEALRCYRCWGLGHIAARCKGTDRTKCCLRCGQEGHMAKACKRDPSCALCQGDLARSHGTMSSECPLNKKHLRGPR